MLGMSEKVLDVGRIQSTMQSCQERGLEPGKHWHVCPVGVEMEDVEFVSMTGHQLQLIGMGRRWIGLCGAQAQGLRARCDKPGSGEGVAACKQDPSKPSATSS